VGKAKKSLRAPHMRARAPPPTEQAAAAAIFRGGARQPNPQKTKALQDLRESHAQRCVYFSYARIAAGFFLRETEARDQHPQSKSGFV
jgi:hypothetical protein